MFPLTSAIVKSMDLSISKFTVVKFPAEYGKTNKSAWVTSTEANLICWYLINDEYKDVYRLGQELTESGRH